MHKKIMAYMTMIMSVVAMALCLAAPASAEVVAADHVWLLTDGGSAVTAATDWKFYVETPDYLALDAGTWDFEVYALLVNGTGSAASGTYTVTITITDGNGTSVSKVSTLSVVRTVLTEQYANASFSSLQIATLTESDATLTVELKSGSTVLDSYSYELPISSDAPRGVISAWIPAIMGLMITLAVVSVIFKLFEKWQV